MPERQQTLRATIDWSYSLLTESEQRFFRRMAVFAGEGTVADAQAVCSESGDAGLDDLESLVDKALVQVDAGDARLRMLQTIAEYAREALDAAGEHAEIALRHAYRYASVAREIAGDGHVNTDTPPVMGAEDFSFMLEARPGAFIFIGQGDTAGLHHPEYDFNDEIIPIGCSYWAKLVETAMPVSG